MTARELPVRLAIPPHAAVGDVLIIMTQAGIAQVPLPTNAKPGKEMDVRVPVPPAFQHAKLMCAWVRVQREGIEVASAPSPRRSWIGTPTRSPSMSISLSSPRSPIAGSSPASMQRLVVPVPSDAKPGSTLAVQTEAGLFQLQVPTGAKPGKTFETCVPVPADCTYAALTVAWVRVGEMAIAAAAATAAASPNSAQADAFQSLPSASPSQDEADAFLEADDVDDGEPADDEDETAWSQQPSSSARANALPPAPLWGGADDDHMADTPGTATASTVPTPGPAATAPSSVASSPAKPPKAHGEVDLCHIFSAALRTCLIK
mmetsp:Transcript_35880/g.94297  ORF Transcript_35880/g.94297 Transcript_35880/m.94297 type:complete len:318 (+) Transcript_35880:811-1764(+)|eukprot:CAMPEP_0115836964 /NCGR_PEP_ID=MMETSP0287-20121206/4976_1 /TAXON_ID=412157 /ORGANISM="Chrysochromulina rotalis, Strain UIO044" /LENGTH=317 /DNA_ID=CAMNT_0003290459 /DNA_START=1586 /DNA_END=2539 /DNA_ORIENTATION=-